MQTVFKYIYQTVWMFYIFRRPHFARPPYFFTLAEKPSHCFHSCPKGRLKKHLMLKK